jgi:ubiquitin-like protein Pup
MAGFVTKIENLEKMTRRDDGDLPIYMAADSAQKQKKGDDGGGDDSSGESKEGSKKMAKKGQDLKDEMDSLVEDIDAVLEENAEEFVKNYVQRGGE